MRCVWEGPRVFAPISNVSNLLSFIDTQGGDPWSEKVKLVARVHGWMAVNKRIAMRGRRT